jgi:nucleoside phosphorylase
MSTVPTTNTVVLCAALNCEYQALRAQFAGPTHRLQVRGTLFEVGELVGSRQTWTFALTLSDRTNTATAAAVERAVQQFDPQVVLLVGIAGGLRQSRQGDVIAATDVYQYEEAEDTDAGRLPRIKTLRSSHVLIQQANAVARDNRWQKRIKTESIQESPRVFVRPLAAGTKVVTGRDSATARLIKENCGDAQGIEMEGFGLMAGACASSGVHAMVIRGVSDLLSNKSSRSDQSWQPVAAAHAAAFAAQLLDDLDPLALRSPATGPTEPNSSDRGGPKYVGAIGEHATVHIGNFGDNGTGSIHFNQP